MLFYKTSIYNIIQYFLEFIFWKFWRFDYLFSLPLLFFNNFFTLQHIFLFYNIFLLQFVSLLHQRTINVFNLCESFEKTAEFYNYYINTGDVVLC